MEIEVIRTEPEYKLHLKQDEMGTLVTMLNTYQREVLNRLPQATSTQENMIDYIRCVYNDSKGY